MTQYAKMSLTYVVVYNLICIHTGEELLYVVKGNEEMHWTHISMYTNFGDTRVKGETFEEHQRS